MHVHVECAEGEAKFWIEPRASLAENHGLKPSQVKQVEKVVEERLDEIAQAWHEHFRG